AEEARVQGEQAEEAARLAGDEEAKVAVLGFVFDGADIEVFVDEAARGINEWPPGAFEVERRGRRPLQVADLAVEVVGSDRIREESKSHQNEEQDHSEQAEAVLAEAAPGVGER